MADKVTPVVISSGFASITPLNQNFTKLATELNDKVLYRDTAEPNQMENTLDMNSNKIINLPSPVSDLEPARWVDVKNGVNILNALAVPALIGNEHKFLSTDGTDLIFKRGSKNSIAELTSILKSTLSNRDEVTISGFATQGDGGGGTFFFDSSSTAAANGGTIFETDEGGTGRWIRIFTGSINVKWFGAKGDGSTNDTAAIQAVWDSVTSNAAIFFPFGTYIISDAGNAVDANNKTDITVFGEGAIILVPSGATTSRPIIIRNSDNIEVYGIHFKCEIPLGPSAQPCNGLDLMNVTNAHIHDCIFEGQTSFGLGIFEDTITPLDASCAGFRVHDCYFKDIGSIGLTAFPKIVEGSSVITGCTFENVGNNVTGGGTGNAVKTGAGFEEATVSDCTFINSGNVTTTLAVTIYSKAILSENKFIGCKNINIGIAILDQGLGTLGTYQSLIIDNNKFIPNSDDPGSNGLIELAVNADGMAVYNTNKGHITISNGTVNNTSLTRPFAIIRPQENVARFTFSGHKGNFIGNVFFLADDARGGILLDPLIDDNLVRMSDTSTAVPIICINADGGFITNNIIIEANTRAISAGTHLNKQYISGNKFFKCNTSATANISPIIFGTEAGYVVFGKLFVYDNIMDPTDYTALIGVSVAYDLHHANNVCPKIILTSTAVEFAEMTFGEHTSSGDVAVNGSIEIKDQLGVTRKLATIA